MKSKKTLAQKKEMGGTDTLSGRSKYADKQGGNVKSGSPFSAHPRMLPNKFQRGFNFFTPIDEDK